MLKIKDSVDLKELEKFGFKKTQGNTYYLQTSNDDYDRFETGLVINPRGNFLKNCIFYNITDEDNCDEKSEIDILATIDVLYDLFQANLVEKVED